MIPSVQSTEAVLHDTSVFTTEVSLQPIHTTSGSSCSGQHSVNGSQVSRLETQSGGSYGGFQIPRNNNTAVSDYTVFDRQILASLQIQYAHLKYKSIYVWANLLPPKLQCMTIKIFSFLEDCKILCLETTILFHH